MRTSLVALLLCATGSAAQGFDPNDCNGRLESMASSATAIMTQAAVDRGSMRAEIGRLMERIKELEKKLSKPEPEKKP